MNKSLLIHNADASKKIKETKKKIEELVKGKPNVIIDVDESQINLDAVERALDLKIKMDILGAQIDALNAQYRPLREEILESLPGEDRDKIECIINGICIKKHSQVKGAMVLNQEKAMKLVKNKRLVQKVTEKVRVVNEDALLLAVSEGLITEDEYAGCVSRGNLSEVLKLERKFHCPDQSVNLDEDVEKEHNQLSDIPEAVDSQEKIG